MRLCRASARTMGSADSKLNFRKAVIQLTTKTQVRAAMSRGDRHVRSLPEAAEGRRARAPRRPGAAGRRAVRGRLCRHRAARSTRRLCARCG